MASLKTQRGSTSVTAFIAALEDESQRIDCEQLLKLFAATTKLEPAVWSNGTIGFGTFHYKSERSAQEGDWYLTGFAPRKGNITIYINLGLSENAALLAKLGKHKISGGSCLYIKRLSDIDTSILQELIQDSVKRMKQRYSITKA